jgi:hypothetical protein
MVNYSVSNSLPPSVSLPSNIPQTDANIVRFERFGLDLVELTAVCQGFWD